MKAMNHPQRQKPLNAGNWIVNSPVRTGFREVILTVTVVALALLFNPVAGARAAVSCVLPTEGTARNTRMDSGQNDVSREVTAPTPQATPAPYAMDASGTNTSAPDRPSETTEIGLLSWSGDDADSTLPASDGTQRRVRVPILMYHYVSEPPKGANDIRLDLSLPGPDFELQLRYLINEGYHTIGLTDLILHLQQGVPLPEKPIVLTFDDGYKDAFTVAFPLLKKYGLTGTFFVFTQPVEEENRDYLSWQEIELMSAAGMEIGCHSYSHPDLRDQPDDVLVTELIDSKKEIESHINEPVLTFCYPANTYDSRVLQTLREAGYWAAVTTHQGMEHTADNRLLLRRIRVRGEAGLERFDAALNAIW